MTEVAVVAVKEMCKGKTVGRLKEVPQIRTSSKGKKYCFFKLEVRGEKFSNWFDFQAWGEKAEEICKCKCGSVIEVTYDIKNNEYTTKDGQKKQAQFSPDAFTSKITVISQPEAGAEGAGAVSAEEDDLPF